MGCIIFLWTMLTCTDNFKKNPHNIIQRSNRKLTYQMDYRKKETWKGMDKFFWEYILVD